MTPQSKTCRSFFLASVHLGLLAAVFFLAGCATTVPEYIPIKRSGPCTCVAPDYSGLHIRYFGTGGFLFEYGTNAILTAPFFSNPNPVRAILPFPISPKRSVIDRLLPDVSHVDAILVGHSHYDHLLDLPYLLTSAKTKAPVFGDQNTSNILVRNIPGHVHNVDSAAGNFSDKPAVGAWFTNSNQRIRFMPFKSMHAPHYFGRVFMAGEIKEPLDKLPSTPWDWKLGSTLAYLIDFLETNGSVAFRVMYQDSAVNGSVFGKLPQELKDERQVDLAILCVGSFSKTKNYPRGYLNNLQPKAIFIAHWEDFFRPQTASVKVVRGSPLPTFLSEIPIDLKPTVPTLHAPGACHHITF